MTGDESNEWSGTGSVEADRPHERAAPGRSGSVLGAYDVVEGTSSFVVAAIDRDDAWLAIESGEELALEEWL